MSRTVGIVGNEAAKFTPITEESARQLIRLLLFQPDTVAVSGRCPLGGIDIWTIEEAEKMGRRWIEHPPRENNWERGFKPRNLLIAASDEVHCIVVAAYPEGFKGRRFEGCYHCLTERPRHVKSGGCWTAMRAKVAVWHIVWPSGAVDHVARQMAREANT